jgi:hypothetical protein
MDETPLTNAGETSEVLKTRKDETNGYGTSQGSNFKKGQSRIRQ